MSRWSGAESEEERTDLAFPAEATEQLVRLELGLLVLMHARHLEEEARQLLEDGRSLEGQHAERVFGERCW